MKRLEKQNVLGVGITNESQQRILEYVIETVQKKGEKYAIVTPNPEILVYANKHKQFQEILNQARIALCDGVGIALFGKISQKPFVERVTGVDFMEKLCKEVAKQPVTVGFLGAGPKIAERTAECLLAKYPGLKVAFVGQEWSESGFKAASKLESRIKNPYVPQGKQELSKMHNSIDILFVAFGFPKQEEWIAAHLEELPVKVMMAVGGSFDYLSGTVRRAPLLLRVIGLEWLFRLISQPWRWKRQQQLGVFLWLCYKEWAASRFRLLRT